MASPAAVAQHPPRHVLLPFDLRDPAVDVDGADVRQALYNIFPGTRNVCPGRNRSYLSFQLESLPQSPWPVTVGGLPITISAGMQGKGNLFPRQRLTPSKINICQDLADSDLASPTVLLELTRRANEEFQEVVPHVRLVELMRATDGSLYAVLDVPSLKAVFSSLPAKIANHFVGYLQDHEIRRPGGADLPANRDIAPQPTQAITDDTWSDTLRPGVVVCSRALGGYAQPNWFSTTSGVMVENQTGSRFMTTASHGIGKREISQIGQGDVSLVQLKQGINFENSVLGNSAGQAPRFTRLLGEDQSDNKVDGQCYFKSLCDGDMDGVIVMTSVKLESSTNPTEDARRYVPYSWAYLGQEGDAIDNVRLLDATRGSPMWNDDGVVLGFYHCYQQDGPFAGYAAMVNASEMVKAGYHLVK